MCVKHYHQGSYSFIGSLAPKGCGCDIPKGSFDTDHVIYNDPNLPCSDVETGDSLTVILQKIDNKICELQEILYSFTTTTTTSTTV